MSNWNRRVQCSSVIQIEREKQPSAAWVLPTGGLKALTKFELGNWGWVFPKIEEKGLTPEINRDDVLTKGDSRRLGQGTQIGDVADRIGWLAGLKWPRTRAGPLRLGWGEERGPWSFYGAKETHSQPV